MLYFEPGIIREEEYINKVSCMNAGRLRLSICHRLAQGGRQGDEMGPGVRGGEGALLAPGAAGPAAGGGGWCLEKRVTGK